MRINPTQAKCIDKVNSMYVFTTVEQDERVEFLRHYRAGEPLCFENISDGIEHTGYCVTTGRHRIDHNQQLTV